MAGKPNYVLVLADKNNTKNRTRAGAAWESAEGYISIRLSPGIHIDYNDRDDLYISLYPIKEGEEDTQPPMEYKDDIPF